MSNFLKIAAVAACTTFVSSAAMAATATADGSMAVSATVARTCTVTVGALAFSGSISGGSTAQSAVSVSCTAGSSTDNPTVTLSGGGNLNATSGLRQMIGGDSSASLVPYTLSAAAGGANLAPTATVATTVANSGTSYSTTIYGSVDASANYQIGSYNDTVTVTVTYAQ